MMEHADVYELIPVYALGALEEDEAQAVEAHLRQCTACRAELAVYEDVADQIALAVPGAEPPPGLREELLARVERPFPERAAAAAIPAPAPATAEARPGLWQRLNDLFRKLAPLWVPVSLVLIVLLAGSNLLLWQQVREGSTTPSGELVSIYLQGTDAAPQAVGYVIFDRGSENALLVSYRLPELEAGRQYQLWLVRNGERDSGGVFSAGAHGNAVMRITAPRPLLDYNWFGVTVEPAGGSLDPTGERVLGSESW